MLVNYAQGLAGKRWQLYAPWSRLVPSALMDRWASRWPARRLWQGQIACGNRDVTLHIYGGPTTAPGWWHRLATDEGSSSFLVASENLATQTNPRRLAPGRLLLAVYLGQALTELSEQLHLAVDRLSVGLVAQGQEMACWLANIEGWARQVTVITDRRSRLLPLAPSGLALRQLDLTIATVGVDILIVAPEFLPWLEKRELAPGTVVARTDGLPVLVRPGVMGVSINYGSIAFPEALLADEKDIMPLREAVLLAAYYSDSRTVWPTQWAKRLALMQQAVKRSGWLLEWHVTGAGLASGY
ncbi:MAG: hypothetical protein GX033_02940 [Firmicutes bacterium]|nr:hypothetical protein [Bacillota bacterium]